MTPANSRPWWRLCRWCRSPWWRRASLGRRPWQKGRGFLWRRRGPGHLLPGRHPAAACWTARMRRRDSTSPLACRWSAPLPARTEAMMTSNSDAAVGKAANKELIDWCWWWWQLFLSVNGALVDAAAAYTPYITWHYSRLSNWMMDERREMENLWTGDTFLWP